MYLKDLHWLTSYFYLCTAYGIVIFPRIEYKHITAYCMTIEKRAYSEAKKLRNKQSNRKDAKISKKQKYSIK